MFTASSFPFTFELILKKTGKIQRTQGKVNLFLSGHTISSTVKVYVKPSTRLGRCNLGRRGLMIAIEHSFTLSFFHNDLPVKRIS